ncbi:MAG TPA: hypothetical protein VKU41_18900, partial [Polyangiaceae bacterium]|nr:hypothetical protein [Polyangiaceae bacterium]
MKWGSLLPALGAVVLCPAACGGSNGSGGATVSVEQATLAPQDQGDGRAREGKRLFDEPFKHTNGRSCATCHVDGNHFTLLPSDVDARLAANPGDPLFNRIDADDPTAATPTYEHLRRGLIRVTLTLPDNMDLINPDGSQVVTPPDRKFSVWRAVPTVENTFYTAPYQYDGRFATYQIQAQGAVTAHSQGPQIADGLLDLVAAFEGGVFSSDRAESVADQLLRGVPRNELKNPEDTDTSNGNRVYVKACKGCHGGAT